MDKKLLEQYAEIKSKINQLTKAADDLSVKVLGEMVKEEVDTVNSDFGTFSIVHRKNWKYSPVFEQKKVELKEMQKKEESEGIATFTEVNTLSFRQTKNED